MMQRVSALTQRELAATFFSPMAYIVAAVFLVATGYLFSEGTLKVGQEATMRPLFEGMAWLLALAVPLLTMRAIADEFASGTIETLMTAPISDVEVVLGKFLGTFLFYAALLAATVIYVIVLAYYAAIDFGVTAFGYFGLLLLGGLYVAAGIFASAMTRYQLVAALIGVGILSTFTVVVDSLAGLQGGSWRNVLGYVNFLYQFEDFAKGIFDTKALVFFITGTGFFLFLAVKVMESRRWR
jgi:ABC-2 type transport system permease protein